MPLFRIFLLVISLLLISGLMATPSLASDRKAPKIIFYAKDYWESWTQEGKDSLDPRLSINGKSYESCAQLAKDQEGEPMTYQLQIENPHFSCPYVVAYRNIRRPKSALFPVRKIEKDVFDNLDVGSLPWSFNVNDRNLSRIASIGGISKIDVTEGRIDFYVGDDLYVISVISSSDNIGDGTQQLLVHFIKFVNFLKDTGSRRENAYFLLVRDVPGGPIRAQPARFRPAAYDYPPKQLQSQAIVFDERYRDYRNGWTP